MVSWAVEIEKELDFRVEASNLERVYTNLVQKAGMDVLIPLPTEGLVSKPVFAMEYIEEGFVCVCVVFWVFWVFCGCCRLKLSIKAFYLASPTRLTQTNTHKHTNKNRVSRSQTMPN